MNKITFTIGGSLFLANLIIGLLVSAYTPFNLCFTSAVIVITTLLLYMVQRVGLKDGFIVGLYSLNLFLGFVELILGIVAIDSIYDNGCVVAVIILLALQIISLVACKVVSDKN